MFAQKRKKDKLGDINPEGKKRKEQTIYGH
jgi:hypothetical protein